MTKVGYARLFNLGNYENERIELEDEVRPDETNEAAYDRVRQWVEAQGAGAKRKARRGEVLNDIEAKINEAKARFASIERKHQDAVKKYNQLRELLDKHGVPIPDLDRYWDLAVITLPPDDEEQFVSYDNVSDRQADDEPDDDAPASDDEPDDADLYPQRASGGYI